MTKKRFVLASALVLICLVSAGCSGHFSRSSPDISYSVSGFVETTDGAPLANVTVTLSQPGRSTFTSKTDSSGHYTFGALSPVECTVTPTFEGYGFDQASREVTPSASEVNFTAIRIVTPLFGLNFSPYMSGQSPSSGSLISEDQIRQRLSAIAPFTTWVRTFAMNDGLEHIGRIAHELGLKTAVGAWISSDLEANSAEMEALISAAQDGHVDLAIIGSEVMFRNELSESDLIEYIQHFRNEVPSIPVTTAETSSELLARPGLVSACDFLFVNYYPFWNGVDRSDAILQLDSAHREIVDLYGTKSIFVSETGWPSDGEPIGDALPSGENAARYFMDFVSWAESGVDIEGYFYFEAFDEGWKRATEGELGAHWGIWDESGSLKPGMAEVFEGWRSSAGISEPFNFQITFVPAGSSNTDAVEGIALGINPEDYRVVVYTLVREGWWTKPNLGTPLTAIDLHGRWVCDVVTGVADNEFAEVAAYLVPVGYSPPLLSGGALPDAQIREHALAAAHAIRE